MHSFKFGPMLGLPFHVRQTHRSSMEFKRASNYEVSPPRTNTHLHEAALVRILVRSLNPQEGLNVDHVPRP